MIERDVNQEEGRSDEANVENLSRCQVDTPPAIVQLTWNEIRKRRPDPAHVIDFGCGDARFAIGGSYKSYTGIEIDPNRVRSSDVAPGAEIKVACAFTRPTDRQKHRICVGNPPYVRHHDLSADWVERAEKRLTKIEGYVADGRANAYIYFMWLGLDAISADGLAAFIVPYEWVSRPASQRLREYIERKGWSVDVFHLSDAGFERVLTTACLTIIDKSTDKCVWRLFDLPGLAADAKPLKHVTRTNQSRLPYEKAKQGARANRGLSPGDQDFFVLTESKRLHFRLVPGRDVVPAVTTFRHLDVDHCSLTEAFFRAQFVNAGRRCWLLNTNADPSDALKVYLETATEALRSNYTCANRTIWWKFTMPESADILYASGFKGQAPKLFQNDYGVIHVGGVHGIYCDRKRDVRPLLKKLRDMTMSKNVVPLANGFMKIEVNQMNAVLNRLMRKIAAATT